jgi:3-methyladenine DNA glycosylase AlkD
VRGVGRYGGPVSVDARKAAEDIVAGLRPLGSAERAAQEKRYLKSKLDFLGVTLPDIRRVVKAAIKANPGADPREWALELWAGNVWERRMAAVELLKAKRAELTAADLATIEQLIRAAAGWALVDTLAAHVAGHIAVNHRDAWHTIDRWASDEDFWVRRAALLALLQGIGRNQPDTARLDAYAIPMLREKEFFIRKAIGWVLRELSKKQPAYVTAWTANHAREMSGVTFREATRHLPAEDVTMLCSIRSY